MATDTEESYADRRREAIKQAAFDVLSRKGYKAASMLEIAKTAKASNETLYRWYGNKQGLFASLVEDNAAAARDLLEKALQDDDSPLEALHRLGPALLALVTGERAIALNRAAAGDVFETGTLGALIATRGRETIAPLIAKLLERAHATGELVIDDTRQATETYINLLIGDLQARRIIGVLEPVGPVEAERRTARAIECIVLIYGPNQDG